METRNGLYVYQNSIFTQPLCLTDSVWYAKKFTEKMDSILILSKLKDLRIFVFETSMNTMDVWVESNDRTTVYVKFQLQMVTKINSINNMIRVIIMDCPDYLERFAGTKQEILDVLSDIECIVKNS